MFDIDKVMDVLYHTETVMGHLPMVGDYEICSTRELAEVLEKHIPKAPITIKMMQTKRCPTCKCVVETADEEYAYCQYCGQAIKWD